MTTPPPSLHDNAELLRYLVARTKMRDGGTPKEMWVLLKEEDIRDLELIAERLSRMAPHEQAIKRIVVGR